MKYDIVYACGHAGVIQVYGKSADRDRKIKWMETNCLCPNCQANENKKRTEIAIKVYRADSGCLVDRPSGRTPKGDLPTGTEVLG